MARFGVLTWDWREQPNLETLGRILGELGGLSLHQVDTGGDEYAIVISESGGLTDAQVTAVWERSEYEPIVTLDLER